MHCSAPPGINLGFLFVVSLLPFSAALLAHYGRLRLGVGVYWLDILLLGAGLEWAHPVRAQGSGARGRLASTLQAGHIPAEDPASANPLCGRGADLLSQHPGKRDCPGPGPAMVHRLAPAGTWRKEAASRQPGSLGRPTAQIKPAMRQPHYRQRPPRAPRQWCQHPAGPNRSQAADAPVTAALAGSAVLRSQCQGAMMRSATVSMLRRMRSTGTGVCRCDGLASGCGSSTSRSTPSSA